MSTEELGKIKAAITRQTKSIEKITHMLDRLDGWIDVLKQRIAHTQINIDAVAADSHKLLDGVKNIDRVSGMAVYNEQAFQSAFGRLQAALPRMTDKIRANVDKFEFVEFIENLKQKPGISEEDYRFLLSRVNQLMGFNFVIRDIGG